MKEQRDLTVGSPTQILFTFALPFFVANLLQAMYMAVDMLVIGRFCTGATELSAVTNGCQVMMIMILFVIGLCISVTVIVGKYFGAKDFETMKKFIGSSMTAFFYISLAVTAIALILVPWLLSIMHTPPEAVKDAKYYVHICSVGLIFTIAYNFSSAILRGVGNSVIPMIFVGLACLSNVFGDLLLIGIFHMGPTGAAIATVASQALGAFMTFGYLYLHPNIFRFQWDVLKFDFQAFRKLLSIGLPIAIQSILIDLSFMIILSLVNGFGEIASAGYGIATRLNGLILLPAMSMGMAMTPIIAQNLGVKKYDRAMTFFKLSVFYSTLIGLGLFVWMRYWPETAFGFFTPDKAIIAAGAEYMRSFCFEILVLGFVFSSNGFLNGSGHTKFSMMMNVLPTIFVRVPFAWYVSILPGATLYGLGFASPLASFVTVFIMLAYLATGRWKINRI